MNTVIGEKLMCVGLASKMEAGSICKHHHGAKAAVKKDLSRQQALPRLVMSMTEAG